MSKQANKQTVSPKLENKKKLIKKSFIEKHAIKIVVIITVLALSIRLYRIGFLSLWVDEYMHAIAAINGKFKHGENNGILLTWLNTTFSLLFGKNEFVMRLPVALLGAALIPIVYVFGKKIANFRVGLMAAFLTALSLYLIFWSRVDRPYGMVASVYLPLLLSFWLMLESKEPIQSKLFNQLGINPKYLLFVVLGLILSMLSQLICFLFIFSAGFYGTFVAIDAWITKKFKPWTLNMYNILFYLNVVAVFLMFTPIGNQLMRPIIELFLPPNIATLILPNMKAVLEAYNGKDWLKSFNIYMGVINTDFKLIPFLAWIGFALAFLQNRKLSYFLISSFVVPLVLMSFIFREPVHAKYLSYIYPVFLISAAYALYNIVYFLVPKLQNGVTNQTKYPVLYSALFIGLLLFSFKNKEIKTMLNTQKHGNVVPKEISEIHFVNWNQPLNFVKSKYKEGDILMATVKEAARFYLQTDSVIWFRQMHYDASKKSYVKNLPDNRPNSAYTYEQLVKTYQNNKRGWLLADYYFDNALTDPQAKRFVEQNMVYHFDACEDGAVKVFSWDKDQPKPYNSAFVIELGKNPNQYASFPLSINLNQTILTPKVNVYITAQGIDSNNEAYLVLNEKGDKAVPIKTNGKANQIGYFIAEVDASLFVNGENKIQFVYNETEGNGDVQTGFVVYNLEIR